MKTRSYILILLSVILTLTSCGRGFDRDAVLAIPDGAAKDSAYLYYNTGLTKGRMMVAVDTFYLNTRADSQYKKGLTENDGIPVDDFRGARVLPCDSILILGGFKQKIIDRGWLKKERLLTYIQVRVFRDGKRIADGWNYHGTYRMADPKAPYVWNEFFCQDTASRVFDLLVLSLAVCIIYWIWKLIYKLVCRKSRGTEPFWEERRIYTKLGLFTLSGAFALCYFLIKISEPMFLTLRYNPDFLSRLSEYPFNVQAIPFIFGLWILCAVGMLIEMIHKYRTLWLIIYYPGTLALAMLIVALVMTASGLIYVMLPGLIIFGAMMLLGGGSSGSGSSKPKLKYHSDMTGKDYSSDSERLGEEQAILNRRAANR